MAYKKHRFFILSFLSIAAERETEKGKRERQRKRNEEIKKHTEIEVDWKVTI